MVETHPEKRLIGYARVSTYGQTLDAQLEQLRAAGCTAKIYREKVTGAHSDRRELLNRHSPDSGLLGVIFRLIDAPTQPNSIAAEPLAAKMASSSGSRHRNSLLCLHLGAPLPSWSVASDPILRSCWRGRRPQPGDQRQDLGEHLSRHRDLGHLESHVAPVADHLGSDLDQLLAQAGQRPRLRRLRRRQRPHEVAKVVGKSMKLEANRVGGKGTARQASPLDRALAFLDPLLRSAAVIVESDDALGWSCQVGHDEADARVQLARMPLDLGHHSAGLVP